MKINVFWKTVRDSRFAVLWWSVGFIALSLYLMYFYPYISRNKEIIGVLDKLPPMITNLFGDISLLTTPEGFFNLQPFSMFAPLLFIIFAVVKGNDLICGEKERGTLDLLLTNPISRIRLVLEKFFGVVMMMLVIALVFWVSMTLSTMLFKVPLNKSHLAAAILSCWGLGVVFAAMVLLTGSLFLKKKISSGIVSGVIVVTYLVNAYAPMVEVLKPYRYFSPFYYYNGAVPLVNGLNIGHFATLCMLSIIFIIASLIIFRNKDL